MRSEQILPIGTLLQGRYKIEKVRGKGGFGITYCAMDLKMHARVAIKACVREQEQAARRVQNEATIMGPDRKSTRLNSSHRSQSRMPSSA